MTISAAEVMPSMMTPLTASSGPSSFRFLVITKSPYPSEANLMVLLPDDLLAEIDGYRRRDQDIPPRTEAIRRLIRAGLDAVQAKPARRKKA